MIKILKSKMAVLSISQLGQLEKLLARQMLKWMAEDESFVTSYWHISPDEVVRRCQLDAIPDSVVGNDTYFLFRLYRVYEEVFCCNNRSMVIDFNKARNDIIIVLDKIKNLELKAKIKTIINKN